MDSLYNVPTQTLRRGCGTHTVLASQTLHHHDVWIVEPLAIKPLALYFRNCTLNCCQGKTAKNIYFVVLLVSITESWVGDDGKV